MPFQVKVNETDLYIRARTLLHREAKEAVFQARHAIEEYIKSKPLFKETHVPLPADPWAPTIVCGMLDAAQKAGVGPMAAIAGAIAEFVGEALFAFSPEVIVENGGDVYLRVKKEQTIGIFAGPSPLSMKVGVRIPPESTPLGVCTSSGIVGHSQSFGKANAVCVVSDTAMVADAAATALGNMVQGAADIEPILKAGQTIPGVDGIVIIVGNTMGVWGNYELVYLN